MKNKKGVAWFTILIILFLLFFALFILSLFQRDRVREQECFEQCQEYNASFVDYESPGYRNEECWCKRDGEPLRIW